jgi:hypothetical protein
MSPNMVVVVASGVVGNVHGLVTVQLVETAG